MSKSLKPLAVCDLRAGPLLIGWVGLLLVLSGGCNRDRQDPGERMEEAIREPFEAYLTGDETQARKALREIIEICENSHDVFLRGRAWTLYLAYARSFALNARTGEEDLARLDKKAAIYWAIRAFQLRGYSVSEIIDYMDTLTPERLVELSDRFDRVPSGGKGPKYLRNLRNNEDARIKMDNR